jgi:hypothetical protein
VFDTSEIPGILGIGSQTIWPEISVADIPVRIQELGVVEDIEELRAEFEVLTLGNRQQFLNGEIEVIDPRTATESA